MFTSDSLPSLEPSWTYPTLVTSLGQSVKLFFLLLYHIVLAQHLIKPGPFRYTRR